MVLVLSEMLESKEWRKPGQVGAGEACCGHWQVVAGLVCWCWDERFCRAILGHLNSSYNCPYQPFSR